MAADKKIVLKIDPQGESDIVGVFDYKDSKDSRNRLSNIAKEQQDFLKTVVTDGTDMTGKTVKGNTLETFDLNTLEDSGYPIF
jgi:hypothetical protein